MPQYQESGFLSSCLNNIWKYSENAFPTTFHTQCSSALLPIDPLFKCCSQIEICSVVEGCSPWFKGSITRDFKEATSERYFNKSLVCCRNLCICRDIFLSAREDAFVFSPSQIFLGKTISTWNRLKWTPPCNLDLNWLMFGIVCVSVILFIAYRSSTDNLVEGDTSSRRSKCQCNEVDRTCRLDINSATNSLLSTSGVLFVSSQTTKKSVIPLLD